MSESLSVGLLRTRFAATIALIVTGLLAFLSFRDAFLHRVATWLIQPFLITSRWVVVVFNLAFYALLMWSCFTAFLAAKGKERIIVAGWWFGFAMLLVQRLASQPMALAIQWLKAAAMVMAFLAALDIVVRYSVNHANVQT